MCHKKAGNEDGARRARANIKDAHWCVTLFLLIYQIDETEQLFLWCSLRNLHVYVVAERKER